MKRFKTKQELGNIIADSADTGKDISRSDFVFYNKDNSIELTPEQFLEGYLPEKTANDDKYDQTMANISKMYNQKLITEMANFSLEPKKLDAYIDNLQKFHVCDGDKVIMSPVNVKELWQYNLMSEEAFKAKHPDKLKFKDWEVDVKQEEIQIHCPGHEGIYIRKTDLERWKTISTIMTNHKTDLNEVYKWMDDNHKKLGL